MLIHGDCRQVMREMIQKGIKVQTCITSPPYFGLRNYGVNGQMGLEETPDDFIKEMVGVFGMVKQLLKNDGTLWVNIGDSYSHGGNGSRDAERWPKQSRNKGSEERLKVAATHAKKKTGLKPKDLIGIPWMLAFALRSDGWYLRQDIIWHKPNPMPESVADRCTKAHEYIFLLSKSPKYYFNADAIKERAGDWGERDRKNGKYHNIGSGLSPHKGLSGKKLKRPSGWADSGDHSSIDWNRPREKNIPKNEILEDAVIEKNKRSVWSVAPAPFSGAHFATYPPKLIEPCILAGARPGDTVLDPFSGSGTTGMVAYQHGREYIGIELNQEYIEISKKRTGKVQVDMLTSNGL